MRSRENVCAGGVPSRSHDSNVQERADFIAFPDGKLDAPSKVRRGLWGNSSAALAMSVQGELTHASAMLAVGTLYARGSVALGRLGRRQRRLQQRGSEEVAGVATGRCVVAFHLHSRRLQMHCAPPPTSQRSGAFSAAQL